MRLLPEDALRDQEKSEDTGNKLQIINIRGRISNYTKCSEDVKSRIPKIVLI
jgi:hypothetical protein